MPPYVLLVIAFITLIASAVSYFFAKARLLSCTLLLFYTSNTFLSFLLFSHQTVLFSVIVTLFVALPIICLIIFAVDMYFAIFCTDTSFVFVLVWLLMPLFFIINLVRYILKIVHG